GIAQALVNDPDLVILDEPQSGLDPVGRKDVRDLIFELREDGKTVVFSSHILVDVQAICDRVAVMNEGELVEVTDLDSLDGGQVRIEVNIEGLSPNDLDQLEDIERLETSGDTLLVVLSSQRTFDRLVAMTVDSDATLLKVDRHRRRLEDQFLADTQTS
ncbi:MAG: ABC transporter ATP-binding protein, partial [Bradymonadaceae bacterium]